MSSKVLGIDLGTTYSCVAYIDQYGKAVVLKNSDGDHTTPSVVMVESEGSTIVGTEAKRSIELEPDKTVQFIKRKMGKDDDTVELNGTTYHAPEISAMILRKIVKDAVDDLRQIGELADGEDIKDVVITCPAYFGMNEKQATITAGKLAGLNVLNIIQEPSAAAISYGVSGNDKNETVLVYDLGGGTFDITVMDINKRGGKFTIDKGKHLVAYTELYKEFINKEIEIINPDIVVLVGVNLCRLRIVQKLGCLEEDNKCYFLINKKKVPILLSLQTANVQYQAKRYPPLNGCENKAIGILCSYLKKEIAKYKIYEQ